MPEAPVMLEVQHSTAYHYVEPVLQGRNDAWLIPRETPTQKVLDARVGINPEPEPYRSALITSATKSFRSRSTICIRILSSPPAAVSKSRRASCRSRMIRLPGKPFARYRSRPLAPSKQTPPFISSLPSLCGATRHSCPTWSARSRPCGPYSRPPPT